MPADKTATNKASIVQAWQALAVPTEAVRAMAGDAAAAAKGAPSSKKPAAPKAKRKKASADSSDEEAGDDSSDDEQPCEQDSDGDNSDDESEDDESEASEEEEETWDVAAIHGKRGRGKTLQYDVEWETGEPKRTWEPAALLTNNVVLQQWLDAQRKKAGKKAGARA